jgi:hypothetical protein
MLRIVVVLNPDYPMDGAYNIRIVQEDGTHATIGSIDNPHDAGEFAAGAAAALRTLGHDAEMTYSMECFDDNGRWAR